MKYYSINENTNEIILSTLRDFDYIDNITPSYPLFSIIHDEDLPVITEKQAYIASGERGVYKYMKDDIEITINNVLLTSQNVVVVEDHRAGDYYSTKDGSKVEIKELGPLPGNVTDQPKPDGHYKWNGKTWVEDTVAKDEAQKQSNIAFLNYEENRTEDAIAKLKRVVDRNIATTEELEQFEELEIYSIYLMRVPNQKEWPLNPTWPTCPEFFKQ